MYKYRQLLQSILAETRSVFPRHISTGVVVNMPIKVGDKIPSVDLYENNPGNKLNAAQIFGKGKHVIFAIPGAFTPTCTEKHVPTFVTDISKIKAKKVDSVNCISINDPFVMASFGKHLKADGKVRMLADTCGDFTKAIDMELDLKALLGNTRSKRYAMVVNDGVVTALTVEENPADATCTKSSDILGYL
nr:peroxiredoxin 5 [Cristaria plicata]